MLGSLIASTVICRNAFDTHLLPSVVHVPATFNCDNQNEHMVDRQFTIWRPRAEKQSPAKYFASASHLWNPCGYHS